MIRRLKNIGTLLSLTVIILAGFFVLSGITTEQTITNDTPTENVAVETEDVSREYQQHFDSLVFEATAVHVYDVVHDRELFAYNAEEVRPLASLTKLMTALVAREFAPNNNVVVTVTEHQDADFLLQEQWNIQSLLDVTLVSSSNDGAYAVASAIAPFIREDGSQSAFITAMNKSADRIGLQETSFLSTTGLDINNETEPSALGSARDVTKLFTYILEHHPTLLDPTTTSDITRTSLANRVHYAENTNTIVNEIPWLIGSKTGFTDTAGGNLVVAFDAGPMRPIVITVLGSTLEGRFTDVLTLIDATLASVNHGA